MSQDVSACLYFTGLWPTLVSDLAFFVPPPSRHLFVYTLLSASRTLLGLGTNTWVFHIHPAVLLTVVCQHVRLCSLCPNQKQSSFFSTYILGGTSDPYHCWAVPTKSSIWLTNPFFYNHLQKVQVTKVIAGLHTLLLIARGGRVQTAFFFKVIAKKVSCKASPVISWWDRNRTALHTCCHSFSCSLPILGQCIHSYAINNSTPAATGEERDREEEKRGMLSYICKALWWRQTHTVRVVHVGFLPVSLFIFLVCSFCVGLTPNWPVECPCWLMLLTYREETAQLSGSHHVHPSDQCLPHY